MRFQIIANQEQGSTDLETWDGIEEGMIIFLKEHVYQFLK